MPRDGPRPTGAQTSLPHSGCRRHATTQVAAVTSPDRRHGPSSTLAAAVGDGSAWPPKACTSRQRARRSPTANRGQPLPIAHPPKPQARLWRCRWRRGTARRPRPLLLPAPPPPPGPASSAHPCSPCLPAMAAATAGHGPTPPRAVRARSNADTGTSTGDASASPPFGLAAPAASPAAAGRLLPGRWRRAARRAARRPARPLPRAAAAAAASSYAARRRRRTTRRAHRPRCVGQ